MTILLNSVISSVVFLDNCERKFKGKDVVMKLCNPISVPCLSTMITMLYLRMSGHSFYELGISDLLATIIIYLLVPMIMLTIDTFYSLALAKMLYPQRNWKQLEQTAKKIAFERTDEEYALAFPNRKHNTEEH